MKQKITVGIHIERLADNKWIIRECFPDHMLEALQVYIQEDLHELIKNIFGHALFHFFWYILEDDVYPDKGLGSSFKNFIAKFCKVVLMSILFISKFLGEGLIELYFFRFNFLSI